MRILLAVIGNDVHVVANKIIDQFLSGKYFIVANLGVACKPDEIIDAIQEFEPSITIISSLNGEGQSWGKEFIESFRSLNSSTKIVLGGNLYPRSSQKSIEETERLFYCLGFDKVLDYRRPLSDLYKYISEQKYGSH